MPQVVDSMEPQFRVCDMASMHPPREIHTTALYTLSLSCPSCPFPAALEPAISGLHLSGYNTVQRRLCGGQLEDFRLGSLCKHRSTSLVDYLDER